MRCRVDDLTPGMILAADLREAGGRLLLPAATELTDRHLRYFQMWGVVEADVAGDEAESAGAVPVDPEVRAAIEARLAALFRHADLAHPAVAQVYSHCLERELRHAAEGRESHVP